MIEDDTVATLFLAYGHLHPTLHTVWNRVNYFLSCLWSPPPDFAQWNGIGLTTSFFAYGHLHSTIHSGVE